MNPFDWETLKSSWASTTYQWLSDIEPPITRWIDALQETYEAPNEPAFACLGMFRVSDDPVLDALIASGQVNYWDLPHHFLTSDAVRDHLPELAPPAKIPRDHRFDFEMSAAFGLAGQLAKILNAGSVYERFDGSPADAMDISLPAADAITGRRYDEFFSWETSKPWSTWFFGTWDYTLILLDKRTRRLTLICTTTSD